MEMSDFLQLMWKTFLYLLYIHSIRPLGYPISPDLRGYSLQIQKLAHIAISTKLMSCIPLYVTTTICKNQNLCSIFELRNQQFLFCFGLKSCSCNLFSFLENHFFKLKRLYRNFVICCQYLFHEFLNCHRQPTAELRCSLQKRISEFVFFLYSTARYAKKICATSVAVFSPKFSKKSSIKKATLFSFKIHTNIQVKSFSRCRPLHFFVFHKSKRLNEIERLKKLSQNCLRRFWFLYMFEYGCLARLEFILNKIRIGVGVF